MKLAELGEFGLIERICRAVPNQAGLQLGIGDDCAATTVPAGELLLTTCDMLLEGVHFRRDWTDLAALGRKSVAVNVSDIAAMGGTVRHLYLGLGLPAELTVAELDDFMAGFLGAAADYGAVLAGGDTCASRSGLVISVTAEGTVAADHLVRRSGARPGDALFVSGTLGDSALALRELQAGRLPEPLLARRHHQPTARARLGQELARRRLATAMIDLSDGLLADLGHLLRASSCGAEIAAHLLPLSPPFSVTLETDPALLNLALSGGEDYELLFAVPPTAMADVAAAAAAAEVTVTRIGTLTAAAGGLLVHDRTGAPLPLTGRGFDHFAGRG